MEVRMETTCHVFCKSWRGASTLHGKSLNNLSVKKKKEGLVVGFSLLPAFKKKKNLPKDAAIQLKPLKFAEN